MRRAFAELLHERMKADDRLYVVTADLGYGVLDAIRADFPGRFADVGAAEQLLIGVGVGLSYQGLIPVCYSITPFLLRRPFEMLHNYLDGERAAVKLVGAGRGREYLHDGPTHWAEDARAILGLLPAVRTFEPETKASLEAVMGPFLDSPGPAFLSLSRFGGDPCRS